MSGVLIVEDSKVTARFLRQGIERRLDLDVTWASTYEEATAAGAASGAPLPEPPVRELVLSLSKHGLLPPCGSFKWPVARC